jgi:tRNA1Val (adenine37-N6)-methyltransferase
MSTINPHFTFHYSQPNGYNFSHDSVFLARAVFEWCLHEGFRTEKALDLCAGCGIVGLDFLFHARKENQPLPRSFDFVEVQNNYRQHFDLNVQRLGEIPTRLEFISRNYEDLKDREGLYDLILCNPPYFRPDQGTLSPSEFKNRCRFFIDSDFPHLLSALTTPLSEQGSAFVLLRDLGDHGWNTLIEAQEILGSDFTLERIGDIRGTDLVQIQKRKS